MKGSAKEWLAIAVPYFTCVGLAFLFGFWGAFNINILEFANLGDLVALSIYPVLASLVFFLLGTLIHALLQSKHLPPGGGAGTAVGQFGIRHWRSMCALLAVAVVVLAVYGREPGKWLIVATMVSLFSIPLSHVDALIELMPNPRTRATLLWFFIFLPAAAFSGGRIEAFIVKAGRSPQIVDADRSMLPLVEDKEHRVAYLGFIGGTYLLFEEKTGQIVLVKQHSERPLFIGSRNKP